MSDSIPSAGRSVAVMLGAVVLLALALVYAAIAALFGSLFWSSGRFIVRVGDDLRFYPDFSLNGLLVFAPLCLLSAYGGLASIRRWSGWVSVAQAAGWGTVALSIYGLWTFLILISPGVPYPPFAIGVVMPIHVAMAVGLIGILVLLLMRRPAVR